MRTATLKHKFVVAIPDLIEDGMLYVALDYRTVMHKCCCGCGHEVVTPLGPTDWKLIFDGMSVSLYPSVGNWSLACRSHYWIDGGKVKWSDQWSDAQVAAGRTMDRAIKAQHYGMPDVPPSPVVTSSPIRKTIWERLADWLK